MLLILKLAFVLAIAYGALSFVPRKATIAFPFAKLAAVAGMLGFILLSFIVKVGAQEVGVLVTPGGVSTQAVHTGWHLVAPWNSVYMMDRTVWVYTFTNKKDEGQVKGEDAIWTPTKDGIKMGLDLSISWKIDPEFAPWIYQNVSENDGGASGRYLWIEQNIIRAKTKSALALTVSDYTPIEVYSSKRQSIQDVVMKKLAAELALYHIVLEQVDIREVFYNEEYEKAINNKKLAEQEALRLVEVTKQKEEQLKQASIEKDIAIQKAQGESEALKIKGVAISSNPKIIQLEWIAKWDGSLPTYMLGNSNGVILNLDQNKDK
jgi:regulator of protease activity HflC (stomatin/prohibitin superfamily)